MSSNKPQVNIQDLTGAGDHGMKRSVGLFRAIGLMGGLMIGSGIFYVGVFVLDYVNISTGWALMAWIIGGVFSLGAGLCYAEMGAAMPRVGGSYLYVTEAFGPCAGFTMGWADFWIIQTGSISAVALGASQYFCSLVGVEGIGLSFIAVIIIVILSIINMLGAKEGSTVSAILLVIKVGLIFFIILTGLSYKGGSGDPISFAFDGSNFIGAISMGVVAVLWAFDGWTSVCMIAEEIKEPQKNIPRALVITLTGITIVYILYNITLMRLLPAADIAVADNPTYDGVEMMFGTGAAVFLTIGVLISIIGSANSCILTYPREYYAMARDKRFFKVFGKLSMKTGTPINSQIITMVYASIICFFASFQELVNITELATWVYYTLAVASLYVLRRKYPNIERPYKVVGYPVVPALVIVGAVTMLLANFFSDPQSIIGLLIPLSGVPAYFIFRKHFQAK